MSDGERQAETEAYRKRGVKPLWLFVVALILVMSAREPTRQLLSVLGLAYGVNLVHLLGLVVMGVLARVPIEEIAINIGPKLATVDVGNTRLSIRLLPVGGFVSLKGLTFAGEDPDEGGFRRRGLPLRLAIVGSGAVGTFLVAVACLGPTAAAHHLSAGFAEILMGAFAPLSQGQMLIGKALELSERGEWVILFGILAAKITAFNLLPLPSLNGGQILLELVRRRIEHHGAEKKAEKWTLVGLMGLLPLFVGWLIALSRYAMGGH